MTPAQLRRARASDPTQYAETMTALLLAAPLARLPYAIAGQEDRDAAAIAAVADLVGMGMVRRTRVRCEGEVVEVAIRVPVHQQNQEAA